MTTVHRPAITGPCREIRNEASSGERRLAASDVACRAVTASATWGRRPTASSHFLAATGQHWWQMLPLGPTGYGNSPYQSHSSFAGNPLLIDLDDLVARGWLAAEACPADPRLPDGQGRFRRRAALEGASLCSSRTRDGTSRATTRGSDEFAAANRVWLDDYVLYQALKDATAGCPGMSGSTSWSRAIRRRLRRWRERLKDGISFHSFVQYAFEIQWQALRAACREHGIMLMGDVPIFVAHDSADVWARPDLFYLDERGQPLVVAGVPPDYFSETGQLWGNPLYRWEVHAAEDYAWWAARLSFLLRRVDLVRIDHFRGFEAYWEIPAGSTDRGARPLGARARDITSSRPCGAGSALFPWSPKTSA